MTADASPDGAQAKRPCLRAGGEAAREGAGGADDAANLPGSLTRWVESLLARAAAEEAARLAAASGGAPPEQRGFTPASAAAALAALVCAELRSAPLAASGDADAAAAAAATGAAALASARADRFRVQGRLLSGCLRADWPLCGAFFFRGGASLPDALAAAAARRAVGDVSRAVIKEHHQRLRVHVAAAAPAPAAAPAAAECDARACDAGADAARRDAWAQALSDDAALDAYAAAATETGQRGWVRAAQQWCLAAARAHFRGGAAAAAALKAAKRAHFAATGAPMPPADVAAAAAAAQAAVDAAVGPPSAGGTPPRLRLVDIGSCHDPWRPFAAEFEVTAFDLRPAVATVYAADALALRVGPPGSAAEHAPPRCAADGAGRLAALPGGSFHVAVLSLVLSYIPDALQRTQVVAQARALLRDDTGLLLIVTPLSTDRSFRPDRALPVLREWRAAIEALGFARCAKARLPTVHCLAFCATPRPAPPAPLARMRIAYDARVPGAPALED